MLPAEIGPGLDERELDRIEERFGFRFAADHRVFPAAGLPHGTRAWPDWRGGDPADLAHRLAGPAEGVLFDVEHARFWAGEGVQLAAAIVAEAGRLLAASPWPPPDRPGPAERKSSVRSGC
ncbi:hypothetical protein [Streptomyces sp. NPDC090036]|uniref:hypothetical protein n=1 Tax=Streptomyces sp. NPDC090036 TaxID=3365926 RepID=UPI00381CEC65